MSGCGYSEVRGIAYYVCRAKHFDSVTAQMCEDPDTNCKGGSVGTIGEMQSDLELGTGELTRPFFGGGEGEDTLPLWSRMQNRFEN